MGFLKIKYPLLEFLDNKYISLEELRRVIITNPEDLVLSTQVSKAISERMKIITANFHVNSVQTVFEGDSANVTTSNQARDNFCSFLTDITTNKELNHTANLVITPFVIDHDGDITFEMYDSGNNVVINTFATTLGSITINLYGRATMVSNEKMAEK